MSGASVKSLKRDPLAQWKRMIENNIECMQSNRNKHAKENSYRSAYFRRARGNGDGLQRLLYDDQDSEKKGGIACNLSEEDLVGRESTEHRDIHCRITEHNVLNQKYDNKNTDVDVQKVSVDKQKRTELENSENTDLCLLSFNLGIIESVGEEEITESLCCQNIKNTVCHGIESEIDLGERQNFLNNSKTVHSADRIDDPQLFTEDVHDTLFYSNPVGNIESDDTNTYPENTDSSNADTSSHEYTAFSTVAKMSIVDKHKEPDEMYKWGRYITSEPNNIESTDVGYQTQNCFQWGRDVGNGQSTLKTVNDYTTKNNVDNGQITLNINEDCKTKNNVIDNGQSTLKTGKDCKTQNNVDNGPSWLNTDKDCKTQNNVIDNGQNSPKTGKDCKKHNNDQNTHKAGTDCKTHGSFHNARDVNNYQGTLNRSKLGTQELRNSESLDSSRSLKTKDHYSLGVDMGSTMSFTNAHDNQYMINKLEYTFTSSERIEPDEQNIVENPQICANDEFDFCSKVNDGRFANDTSDINVTKEHVHISSKETINMPSEIDALLNTIRHTTYTGDCRLSSNDITTSAVFDGKINPVKEGCRTVMPCFLTPEAPFTKIANKTHKNRCIPKSGCITSVYDNTTLATTTHKTEAHNSIIDCCRGSGLVKMDSVSISRSECTLTVSNCPHKSPRQKRACQSSSLENIVQEDRTRSQTCLIKNIKQDRANKITYPITSGSNYGHIGLCREEVFSDQLTTRYMQNYKLLSPNSLEQSSQNVRQSPPVSRKMTMVDYAEKSNKTLKHLTRNPMTQWARLVSDNIEAVFKTEAQYGCTDFKASNMSKIEHCQRSHNVKTGKINPGRVDLASVQFRSEECFQHKHCAESSVIKDSENMLKTPGLSDSLKPLELKDTTECHDTESNFLSVKFHVIEAESLSMNILKESKPVISEPLEPDDWQSKNLANIGSSFNQDCIKPHCHKRGAVYDKSSDEITLDENMCENIETTALQDTDVDISSMSSSSQFKNNELAVLTHNSVHKTESMEGSKNIIKEHSNIHFLKECIEDPKFSRDCCRYEHKNEEECVHIEECIQCGFRHMDKLDRDCSDRDKHSLILNYCDNYNRTEIVIDEVKAQEVHTRTTIGIRDCLSTVGHTFLSENVGSTGKFGKAYSDKYMKDIDNYVSSFLFRGEINNCDTKFPGLNVHKSELYHCDESTKIDTTDGKLEINETKSHVNHIQNQLNLHSENDLLQDTLRKADCRIPLYDVAASTNLDENKIDEDGSNTSLPCVLKELFEGISDPEHQVKHDYHLGSINSLHKDAKMSDKNKQNCSLTNLGCEVSLSIGNVANDSKNTYEVILPPFPHSVYRQFPHSVTEQFPHPVCRKVEFYTYASADNLVTEDTHGSWKNCTTSVKQDTTSQASYIDINCSQNVGSMMSRTDGSVNDCRQVCSQCNDQMILNCVEYDAAIIPDESHPSNRKESKGTQCLAHGEDLNQVFKPLTRNPMTQWTRLVNANTGALLENKRVEVNETNFGGGNIETCEFGKSGSLKTRQSFNKENKNSESSDFRNVLRQDNCSLGKDAYCLQNVHSKKNHQIPNYQKDIFASLNLSEQKKSDCNKKGASLLNKLGDGKIETGNKNFSMNILEENKLESCEAAETVDWHWYSVQSGSTGNSYSQDYVESYCQESDMNDFDEKKANEIAFDEKCMDVCENYETTTIQDKDVDSLCKSLTPQINNTEPDVVCTLNSVHVPESVKVDKCEIHDGNDPVFVRNDKHPIHDGNHPVFVRNDKHHIHDGNDLVFVRNDKHPIHDGNHPVFVRNDKHPIHDGNHPVFVRNDKHHIHDGNDPVFVRNDKHYIHDGNDPVFVRSYAAYSGKEIISTIYGYENKYDNRECVVSEFTHSETPGREYTDKDRQFFVINDSGSYDRKEASIDKVRAQGIITSEIMNVNECSATTVAGLVDSTKVTDSCQVTSYNKYMTKFTFDSSETVETNKCDTNALPGVTVSKFDCCDDETDVDFTANTLYIQGAREHLHSSEKNQFMRQCAIAHQQDTTINTSYKRDTEIFSCGITASENTDDRSSDKLATNSLILGVSGIIKTSSNISNAEENIVSCTHNSGGVFSLHDDATISIRKNETRNSLIPGFSGIIETSGNICNVEENIVNCTECSGNVALLHDDATIGERKDETEAYKPVIDFKCRNSSSKNSASTNRRACVLSIPICENSVCRKNGPYQSTSAENLETTDVCRSHQFCVWSVRPSTLDGKSDTEIRSAAHGMCDTEIRGADNGKSDNEIRGADNGMCGTEIRGADNGMCSTEIRGADNGKSDNEIRGADNGMCDAEIRGADNGMYGTEIRGADNGMCGTEIRGADNGMCGTEIRSANNGICDTEIRGADNGMCGTEIRSANNEMCGTEIRGADNGMCDTEIRGADNGMCDTEIRGADNGMCGTEIRSADNGMCGTEIRSADNGMCGTEIRSADNGMCGTEIRSADNGMCGTEIRGADNGKSDTEIRSAKSGKSNTEIRGADNRKSDTEIRSAKSGKSDTEIRSADNGMYDTEIRGANNGICDTEIRGTDNGICDTEIRGTDNGICDTESRGANNGICDTEIRGTDNGICDTEISDTNSGKSDTEIRSANNGICGTEIRGADNGMCGTEIRGADNGMCGTEIRSANNGICDTEIRGADNGLCGTEIRSANNGICDTEIRGADNGLCGTEISGADNGMCVTEIRDYSDGKCTKSEANCVNHIRYDDKENHDLLQYIEKAAAEMRELHNTVRKEPKAADTENCNRAFKHLTRNPVTQWTRLVNANIEAVVKKKTDTVDPKCYSNGDFKPCGFSKSRSLKTTKHVNNYNIKSDSFNTSTVPFKYNDYCFEAVQMKECSELRNDKNILNIPEIIGSSNSQELNTTCHERIPSVGNETCSDINIDAKCKNMDTMVFEKVKPEKVEFAEKDEWHWYSVNLDSIGCFSNQDWKEPHHHDSEMNPTYAYQEVISTSDENCDHVVNEDMIVNRPPVLSISQSKSISNDTQLCTKPVCETEYVGTNNDANKEENNVIFNKESRVTRICEELRKQSDLLHNENSKNELNTDEVYAQDFTNRRIPEFSEPLQINGQAIPDGQMDNTQRFGDVCVDQHMKKILKYVSTSNELIDTKQLDTAHILPTDVCEEDSSSKDFDFNKAGINEVMKHLHIHSESESSMQCERNFYKGPVRNAIFKPETLVFSRDVTSSEVSYKEKQRRKLRTKFVIPCSINTTQRPKRDSSEKHKVNNTRQSDIVVNLLDDIDTMNKCMDKKKEYHSDIDIECGGALPKRNSFRMSRSEHALILGTLPHSVFKENRLYLSTNAGNIVSNDRHKTRTYQHKIRKANRFSRVTNSDNRGAVTGSSLGHLRTGMSGDGCRTDIGDTETTSLQCLQQTTANASQLHPSNSEGFEGKNCKAHTEQSNETLKYLTRSPVMRALKQLTRNPMTQWTRLVNDNIEAVFNTDIGEIDLAKYGGGDCEAGIFGKSKSSKFSDRVGEKTSSESESARSTTEKLYLSSDDIFSVQGVDVVPGTSSVCADCMKAPQGEPVKSLTSDVCLCGETKAVDYVCSVTCASLRDSWSDYSKFNDSSNTIVNLQCQQKGYLYVGDSCTDVISTHKEYSPCEKACQNRSEKHGSHQNQFLYNSAAAGSAISPYDDTISSVHSENHNYLNVNTLKAASVHEFDNKPLNDLCCLENVEINLVNDSLGLQNIFEDISSHEGFQCAAAFENHTELLGNKVGKKRSNAIGQLELSSVCSHNIELMLQEAVTCNEIKTETNSDDFHQNNGSSEEMSILKPHISDIKIRNPVLRDEWKSAQKHYRADCKLQNMEQLNVGLDEHSSVSKTSGNLSGTEIRTLNNTHGMFNSVSTSEIKTSMSSSMFNSAPTSEIRTSMSSSMFNSSQTSEIKTSVSSGMFNSVPTSEIKTSMSSSMFNSAPTSEIRTSMSSSMFNSAQTSEIKTSMSSSMFNSVPTNEIKTSMSSGMFNSVPTSEIKTSMSSGIFNSVPTSEIKTSVSSGMFNSVPTSEIKTSMSSGMFNSVPTNEIKTSMSSSMFNSVPTNEIKTSMSSSMFSSVPISEIKAASPSADCVQYLKSESSQQETDNFQRSISSERTDAELQCKSISQQQIQSKPHFNQWNNVSLASPFGHSKRPLKNLDVTIYVHKSKGCDKGSRIKKSSSCDEKICSMDNKKIQEIIPSTDKGKDQDKICTHKRKYQENISRTDKSKVEDETSSSHKRKVKISVSCNSKDKVKIPSKKRSNEHNIVSKISIATHISENYDRMSSKLSTSCAQNNATAQSNATVQSNATAQDNATTQSNATAQSNATTQSNATKQGIAIEVLNELSCEDKSSKTGWSRFWHLVTNIFTDSSKPPSHEKDVENQELMVIEDKQTSPESKSSDHKHKVHCFKGEQGQKYSEGATSTSNINSLHNNDNNKKQVLDSACVKIDSANKKHRKRKVITGRKVITDEEHPVVTGYDKITVQSKVKLSKQTKSSSGTDWREPTENILFRDQVVSTCVETGYLSSENNIEKYSYFLIPQDHSNIDTQIKQNQNQLESETVPFGNQNTFTESKEYSDLCIYKQGHHTTKIPVILSRHSKSMIQDFSNEKMTERYHQNEANLPKNKRKYKNESKVGSYLLETESFDTITENKDPEQEDVCACQQTNQKNICNIFAIESADKTAICEDFSQCGGKSEGDNDTLNKLGSAETDSRKYSAMPLANFTCIKEETDNVVHFLDTPARIIEKFSVDTKSVPNDENMRDYFQNLVTVNQGAVDPVPDFHQQAEDCCRDECFDQTESELLQSSLECLLEMLLQRGKVTHAFITNNEGEILAKTAKCTVTPNDIKSILFSLWSSYRGMVKIAVTNDMYTCFKHDQHSLIGRGSTNIFVAHRGQQSVVVGFCDALTPGSCVKEVQEISELLSHRGL